MAALCLPLALLGLLPIAAASDPDALELSGSHLAQDLSKLYDEVCPAVVSVVSYRVARLPTGFPAGGRPSLSIRRLVASGIVIGDRGCVVTTARVAQPGDSVVIHFPGGRMVAASYLGMDPALYIAVLRLLEGGPYPSLPVQAVVGAELPEWVAAVAYGPWTGERPHDPALTLSQRSAVQMVETRFHGAPAMLWRIQAPIFPGNGGGALLTLEGQWLGLITGAVAGEPGGEDCTAGEGPCAAGVIVPADVVSQTVNEIESGLRRSQGFLGVRAVRQPAAAEAETKAGEPGATAAEPEAGAAALGGVAVAEVLPGSAASLAGIQSGDLISRFDGVPVRSAVELTQLIRAHLPGDRVQLALVRNGLAAETEVCLGDHHAAGIYMARRRQELDERRRLGLELRRLDQRRQQIERRLEMLRRSLRGTEERDRSPQTSAAH